MILKRIFGFKKRRWKKVAPGLWEREDTPKRVKISPEIIEVYMKASKEVFGEKWNSSLKSLFEDMLNN